MAHLQAHAAAAAVATGWKARCPSMEGQPLMEWPEFSAWWSQQVQELAPLLVDAQSDPAGPAASKVDQIIQDVVRIRPLID